VAAATPLTRQVMSVARFNNVPGALPVEPAAAVANPGTGTATLTFQLLNDNGAAVGPPVTKTLTAGNQSAFYVSQLFPNMPSGVFIGAIRLTSDSPVVATALAFTGNFFATVPVFAVP